MEPFYKPAIASNYGECVNMIPNKDGTLKLIEATKNAVIVQLFESYDEEENRMINRIICIECVDNEIYPDLKAEALRILRESHQ